MCRFLLNLVNKSTLLLLLLSCQGLSAAIISTEVTAESYSLSYPEPEYAVYDSRTDEHDAYLDTISDFYDTSVHADSHVEARNDGIAFLVTRKYQAAESAGRTAIRYQLENDSAEARKFSLRFNPLFGFLTAYCADPDGQFDNDTDSTLACGPDDFAIASYDAGIWLNDQLIWSSMARLRSDINGVSLDTAGTVLGSFYPDESNYRWDSQWLDLTLDVFNPGEQFSLLYSVNVNVGGQVELQGATSCVPFDCPYPDNVALAEYGTYQFVENGEQQIQFSSAALQVTEPVTLGVFVLGLLLLVIVRRC
ncbi:hypothetical protein [Neptunicella sp. SCSIO 80796]|uniref:hypothetical protein n=1 Tax=Neptunicella plasticusilytica TaxID=3117012 RepID=UPI003A4E58F6